jgi:hypothetical protein
MYFSELFEIEDASSEDWFDPLLDTDTPLFVDPFLIFKDLDPGWSIAHTDIVEHFQRSFELLAGHHENPGSLQYRRVLTLMEFPEPREFGLGYVDKGTRGSGTGAGFAKRIVESMCAAIERGLQDLRHFEELGVLVDRIHRDRISDITCNILKARFIRYTQEVSLRHSITLSPVKVPHSSFDPVRRRWADEIHDLPRNPISGQGVLLTPKRFLDQLPKLNAADWYEYAEPKLRDDLNLDLGINIRKADIIALARQHADLVRAWSNEREGDAPRPYDVGRDPAGLHNWRALTQRAASESPLELTSVRTQAELQRFVSLVVDKFKHRIEEQGLWPLLFNDDNGRPKRELAVQLLFKGTVESYCEAFGVRLDREVELGRGPVDFIVSSAPTLRILLEIKKMSNGKYWNGLERQLVSYLNSDQCNQGWFIAVRYGNTPKEIERTRDLGSRTRAAGTASGFSLSAEWIDARPKESASKISDDLGVRTTVVDDDEFDDDA